MIDLGTLEDPVNAYMVGPKMGRIDRFVSKHTNNPWFRNDFQLYVPDRFVFGHFTLEQRDTFSLRSGPPYFNDTDEGLRLLSSGLEKGMMKVWRSYALPEDMLKGIEERCRTYQDTVRDIKYSLRYLDKHSF